MNVVEAMAARRTIKRFTETPVTRDQIEVLLAAAAQAPNHKLTEPWRFYVLGPESRAAYGRVLGARKAKKATTPEAGELVLQKVVREHVALPAMLAIAMVQAEDPEVREEDYAAVMMGIQNLSLAAVELGLGTHIKTGGVMADPAARAAVGVAENERIVAIINLGEPADVPSPKQRQPAAALTHWRD